MAADGIKLLKEDLATVLENDQTLDQAKVANDSAIYFVFKKEGA